jgi:hypothetical protein
MISGALLIVNTQNAPHESFLAGRALEQTALRRFASPAIHEALILSLSKAEVKLSHHDYGDLAAYASLKMTIIKKRPCNAFLWRIIAC